MAEEEFNNALSSFNSAVASNKSYAEQFVSDAQKEIMEKSDALMGGTLGMIPVVELAGKYLGKATGKSAEGLITKGVNYVKGKMKGSGDEEESADGVGEEGGETVEMDGMGGNSGDGELGSEGTELGNTGVDLGDDSGIAETSFMDADPVSVSTGSNVVEQPSLGSSGAENNQLDDTGYGDLDDDGGLPQPQEQVNQPPAEEQTENVTSESSGDVSSGVDSSVTAGTEGGVEGGAETGASLGAEVGTDVAVETGLNSLDAIPIIGELGMVAGAIYGLVHLFHHPKPKPPPSYNMTAPTMDVDNNALNMTSSPIAHT